MVTITIKDATRVGELLGLNFAVYPVRAFQNAMETELELGQRFGATANVTNDPLLLAGLIVVAHISKIPDWYERTAQMEKDARAYWAARAIPDIFKR